MFNIEQLQNVIVEFMMPFALDIKDSLKEGGITQYHVVIDNIPAGIRTERIYNEDACLSGARLAPYSKIKNDRFGLLSKTKVQVWFDYQMFESPLIDKSTLVTTPNQFYGVAISYLNKLIRNYKRITREYWLPLMQMNDVIGFRYVLLDKNKQTLVINDLITQEVQFNGGKEFELDTEIDCYLRESIIGNHEYLQDDLYLSIIDNFDKGYFNISLIQCAIFFENYVYGNIRGKLSKTKFDKIRKKQPCGCLVGIVEVCTRGINEILGHDFGKTLVFQEFKENVLTLRNKLIHGELLEEVTHSQCEAAIHATMNAVTYLAKDVFLTSSP
ncbi:MAG TPA: hypothetical protein VIF37_08040 [Methylobacter sp.]|jgi:hypothetical protein